jgi:hypothetical protein
MQFLPNRWVAKKLARARITSFWVSNLESEDLELRSVAEISGVVAIIHYRVQFYLAIKVCVDGSFIGVVAVCIIRVQEA